MNSRLCLLLALGAIVAVHLASASTVAEDNARNGDRAGALIKRFDQNIVVQTIKSLIDLTGSSFKSGFEASVRSIFNKPLTTAVYAISMLIGAVAMLTFYESPISPMPVPPLPDPPVGRFPPEHSVWPAAGSDQPLVFPSQNKRTGAGYGQVAAASILNPQYVDPNQGYGQQQGQQGFYPMYGYNNEHHRSDKMPAAQAQPQASRDQSRGNAKAQKTQDAYNDYISKLTAQLNQQDQALAQDSQPQPQYDPSLYADQNNKVIDYTNKRMAVENIKFQGLNSTQTGA